VFALEHPGADVDGEERKILFRAEPKTRTCSSDILTELLYRAIVVTLENLYCSLQGRPRAVFRVL